MQIQVYLPHTVEIPNEYLLALAQRAHNSLAGAGGDVPATRGHLVRQAVRDGLLRELFHLLKEDGSIEVFCDPGSEIPLRIENRTVKLSELVEALQSKRSLTTEASEGEWVEQARVKVMAMPRRSAA
jgi:hypothetical protein